MIRHCLLAATLLLPVAAGAQTPSTESIIRALKPTAAEATGATRGIRPATTTTTPAAEPSHAAAPPSVKLMVDFRTGSAALTPGAETTLDQLGRALTSPSLASFKFRVEGHTDTVGQADANKTLSEKRAEAVTAYLEQKFSIDAARLQAVGLGARELPVPTPDQTAEPRNRVVKVVNLGT